MRAFERQALPRVMGSGVLQELGVSPSTMRTEFRRGTWRRLATNVVLTRPDEPTREDWAQAGVVLAGYGAAVTGWDALRARGLGDRTPPSRLVTVLSPIAMNRVVGGVRIRRTKRPYECQVQPLGAPLELTPLAPIPRAAADAALEYRQLANVQALISSAVQRGGCGVTDLLAEFERCPRNHSRLLRLALADLRDGARSAAESAAARRLARGPIPPFELNVPVVDTAGKLLYVVDVLWRALRAALEIDSREYHFSAADWEATLARHNDLTRRGLAVSHYPPKSISKRGSTFVPEVADWLRGRAIELGVPLPAGRGVRRPPDGADPIPFVVRATKIA